MLIRIDPNDITIDPSISALTEWDRRVVGEDLREYVSKSRIIRCTPALVVKERRFVAKNGVPFVVAAQSAVPPIAEIVCSVDVSPVGMATSECKMVSAAELLDTIEATTSEGLIEMVAFQRPLVRGEREATESGIRTFHAAMQQRSSPSDLVYGKLGPITWDENGQIVLWSWQRREVEGGHAKMLSDFICRLDREVCGVRSWNGLSLDCR